MDREQLTMAITVSPKSTGDQISIVIEGIEVLKGLQTIARASCLLLGLTYALNLAYPEPLKYTFELFEKVFLELNPSKLSPRVKALKSKLLS